MTNTVNPITKDIIKLNNILNKYFNDEYMITIPISKYRNMYVSVGDFKDGIVNAIKKEVENAISNQTKK